MAVRISKEDFEEKVINSTLPVIVDFYSDSCIACKKLAPVLGNIEDDYEDKLLIYKLNTNFDLEVAEKYGVTSNPTLIFFKNGEEVARRVGTGRSDELLAWVEENIE